MDTEQLRELLDTAGERRGLELKSPGPYDKSTGFTGRAVRAVLGLSNLRDGGYLVIGVKENPDGTFDRLGVSTADLATWDQDTFASLLVNYADPSVQFTLEKVELDGKTYVVVDVDSFRETPTICKKPWLDGNDLILRDGGVYVRSLGKNETAEVSSSEDMRALLQVAVERRLADYLSTARRAGVALAAESEPQPEADDAMRFHDQLGDLDEL